MARPVLFNAQLIFADVIPERLGRMRNGESKDLPDSRA